MLPDNFRKIQTYIKAILESQKTYIKGHPNIKNMCIKALKIKLKTGVNRFFDHFWKVTQKVAKF